MLKKTCTGMTALFILLALPQYAPAAASFRLEKDVPYSQVPSRPLPIEVHIYSSANAATPVVSQTFPVSALMIARFSAFSGEGAYRISMDFTETNALTSAMELWWEFTMNGTVIGSREPVPGSAWALFSDKALTAGHANTADQATSADSSATAGHAATAGDADTLDGFHANQLGLGAIDCAVGEVLVRTAAGWDCGAASCIDGDFVSCYGGPASTRNVGTCSDGRRICSGGIFSGTCEGEVLPVDEVCDVFDHDCDGNPYNVSNPSDPNAVVTYPDADGDGFGDLAAASTLSCFSAPPGTSLNNQDCNDGDPLISPGIPEICDGIDNNCDGPADNGCVSGGLCSLGDVLIVEQCVDPNVNVTRQCATDQGVSDPCVTAMLDYWVCGLSAGCALTGDHACYQANCLTEWSAVYGTAP